MNKKVEKQKAIKALNRVVKMKTDIDNAFFCSFGPVCLKYGEPGNPEKNYSKGYGISHIIAKRDYEHAMDNKAFPETGLQLVKKLMDVIVYGKVAKIVPSKQCIHLQKDGLEAVISQNWHGDKVNWLLTGWRQVLKKPLA